jgi:hypothetical protein
MKPSNTEKKRWGYARNIFKLIFIAVLLGFSPAYADMYQWIDEEGVLHIADDMHKVPEEYRSKVKKIETKRAEEEPVLEPSPAAPSQMPEQPGEEEELFGGHPLKWWKEQFDKMKDRIAKVEGSYNKKKLYVDVFERGRRFGQVFETDQIETYERYKKEIPRDEEKLEELNEELEGLRKKATGAGVPKEIRE